MTNEQEVVAEGELTIPWEIVKYTYKDGEVLYDVWCEQFESTQWFKTEADAREWIMKHDN